MNLTADSLGLSTLVFGWLLLLASLAWTLKRAPWHKVKGDRGAQNVWLGMTLIVFLVWQFGAQLEEGIHFHFLLMTLMTLMFGVEFALFGAVLVLIGLSFYTGMGWQAIGINATLMALVPIWITYGFVRISERYLEQNFFVYVFFNGFLAGGIAVVLTLIGGGVIMGLNEVYSFEKLARDFFPFIPLMATPEGFINGMLIAMLIVLKPHWIATFHDETHLKGK